MEMVVDKVYESSFRLKVKLSQVQEEVVIIAGRVIDLERHFLEKTYNLQALKSEEGKYSTNICFLF